MNNYFIIRLGADSEKEIREIDSLTEYSSSSFDIQVKCKQVPTDVKAGDFALVWLGTNNNKGGKTPWVQGLRALGKITDIKGLPGYSESKTLYIEIGVVLPKSVTKIDIITKQSSLYPQIVEMPVLGANNYSSQVVQQIDPVEKGQNIWSLFRALESIVPGFKTAVLDTYPELSLFLNTPKNISLTQIDSKTISNLSLSDDVSVNNTQEDDDGLERDEELDSEIEIPFDPSKIDIIARPMTISSLEGRLDNNELDLTPDFQRQANVWDLKRKARLIESILLKIPLPSFYFSEDTDGGYAVVDGLQRLCAVFHFKNPERLNAATGADLPALKLRGLQYLKELEGKTFGELDRKFQRRISELEITANIIRANTPSAVKFNVFARLNQGGMPLNAQEIRNAIFPGEWRNELRKLAESEEFVKATEGKVRTSRQQDMELVLRYVALFQIGKPYIRTSNQTLDEFLNLTVEQVLTKWDSSEWKKVEQSFKHAIKSAHSVFGKHAFRKSVGSPQRKPINRGLFEAELIVFGGIDPKDFSRITSRQQDVERYFVHEMSDNKDFAQSLLYGTGSAESSNARIDALTNVVTKVLND